MAEEVGVGRVKVEADTKGLGDDIAKKVDGEKGSIGKAFGAVGKAAGLAFKVAAAAAVTGVIAGAAFAKSSVDAASDLSESMSKVTVVFGDQADEVVKWSETSNKAFGASQQAALEAAGTYGNLFQAFGIGQKPAQDMSQSLVELAADLASFNNTSVDDALVALQSGLSGETEPLKRYGVALNDVRLKEEAVALGLIATTKDALTPAAKAQAAYALIMKDTTLAQGDFARTSDGLANQQRILAASWTNLKAKAGAVLLPLFLTVVSFLVDKVIPGIQEFASVLSAAFSGEDVNASGLYKVAERIGDTLRNVVDWVRDNWPTIKEVVGDVFRAIAQFWTDQAMPAIVGFRDAIVGAFQWVIDHQPVLIGILVGLGAVLVALFVTWAAGATSAAIATIAAAAPFIAIGVVIAAVVAGVIYAYQEWEWFRQTVDAVGRWLRDVLWPALQDVFVWMRDNIPPILQAVADFFVTKVVPAAQAVWSFISEKLWPAFQTFAEVLATVVVAAVQGTIDIVSTLWGWLQTLWDRSEGFRGFLADAFRVAFDVTRTTIDTVITIVSTLYDWIRVLWDRAEPFRAFLVGAWKLGFDTARDAVTGVADGLSTTWGWLQTVWDRAEPFRAFLAGAFHVAISGVTLAISAVYLALSTMWGWLQTVWDRSEGLRGFFADTFGVAIDGIATGFGAISSAVETVIGWIQKLVDKAKAALSPLQKLIDVADKINPFNNELDLQAIANAEPRAGGGPVRAGHPYIVGEVRAEVYVPDADGYIYPDARSFGGEHIEINHYGETVTPETISAGIAMARMRR